MIQAGGYDRKVQFRRAALVDDGLVDREVFADLGSPVWASRKDVSDGERWRAAQVSSLITARFRVRYSAFSKSITQTDQIVCEGLTYNITGLKEIGRREEIEISASAQV